MKESDPFSPQEDMTALIHSLLAKSDRPAGRGMTINCPPEPSDGSILCYKFVNPNPDAAWDFYMHLLVHRQGGETAALNVIIALDDGGLAQFIQHNEYETIFKSHFVKTIKAEGYDFGFVWASRLKITMHYKAYQEHVSGSSFYYAKYDANGDPVVPITPVEDGSEFPFPPLIAGAQPGPDATVEFLISQADPRNMRGPRAAIYFPDYTELPDGDFEVDGGVEADPVDSDWMAGVSFRNIERDPGLYIDFAHQEYPYFTMSVGSLWLEDRPPTVLFGDYCTGYTWDVFHEYVYKEKKSSWFKTKTKIVIIRTELHISGRKCGVL